MWRLVRHPDDSLCIGRNDEEQVIPVELQARPHPMRTTPTAHLWTWSICELALGLWKDSGLMFFNFFVSIITNSMVHCRVPSGVCALWIHVMFMVSVVPFIVTNRLLPELVMIAVHLILYMVQIAISIL
jgi:hypothetical protein